MKLTLAFCKKAYEEIMGKPLADNKPYVDAAKEAMQKDRVKFMEMVEADKK